MKWRYTPSNINIPNKKDYSLAISLPSTRYFDHKSTKYYTKWRVLAMYIHLSGINDKIGQ